MSAALAYVSKMTKDEFNRMALEITKASSRLGDSDGFDVSYDAITLEDLWPILNKHLKPDKNAVDGRAKANDKKEKVVQAHERIVRNNNRPGDRRLYAS